MATKDNEEFKYAMREIALKALKLKCPYDRVRVAQWAKKLSQMPGDDLEEGRIKNEYVQYLRIQVRNGSLHGIFKSPPPESYNIGPLAENLGNQLAKKIPHLPRVGPIAPVLQHTSPDGKAYVCAKQMDGGVFCYMAITPDNFK